MAETLWQKVSRWQHTLETGHQTYVTSLDLCLELGIAKGFHGRRPLDSDRVASAWSCVECLARLDETPSEEPAHG